MTKKDENLHQLRHARKPWGTANERKPPEKGGLRLGGPSGAAGPDPRWDDPWVGSGLAAQLRSLPLEPLVGLAFAGTLKDSGGLGQEIATLAASSQGSATTAASSALVSPRHLA